MHKPINHIVRSFVLVCYIFTGLEASQSVYQTSERANFGSRSATHDTGCNNRNDSRPYWTAHKHIPEKGIDHGRSVALISCSPVLHVDLIYHTVPPSVPSALLIRLVDLKTGRAPPAVR